MSWFISKEQRAHNAAQTEFNKELKITIQKLTARSKAQTENLAAVKEALKLLAATVTEIATVKEDMAKVVKTVEGVVVENTNLKDSEKQIIKGFNKAMDDILSTGNL